MQKESKMNKMHTLTKIILSATGIFFAIRLLSQLPLAISYFFSKPSWETAGSLSFAILVTVGLIFVLLYLFFYKSDSLAKKIVGSEQLPEPDSQIQWLPIALRLICITGGIYLLSIVIWQAEAVLDQFAVRKMEARAHAIYTALLFTYRSVLPWVTMLICSIYLLCGAPHFVRWQVKKTLQQCKGQTETS
jgi:hypothetical protein